MRVTAKYRAVYTSKTGSKRTQKQQPSGRQVGGRQSPRGRLKLHSKLRRPREKAAWETGAVRAICSCCSRSSAQRLLATRPQPGHRRSCAMTGSINSRAASKSELSLHKCRSRGPTDDSLNVRTICLHAALSELPTHRHYH